MQPLGNKILVKDYVEQKEAKSKIILTDKDPLKKVKIIAVSEDSQTKLKPDDICLSEYGGVETKHGSGIWLCNESLLWAKI